MKKVIALGAGVLAGLLLASCVTNKEPPLYYWYGYTNAVYDYIKLGDEDSNGKMLEVYQQLLDGQAGTVRQVPPPGVCADYGWMLIQSGKKEEGKDLLRKEMELYPESAAFIQSILRRVN